MQIFGHRGAAGEAPENTIAALQYAIRLGVTRFEIDLRLSADSQLVVLHDSNLLRTTGIDREITEVHSSELAGIIVKGRNGEQTTGVPTLRQLFDECNPIDQIQLELKSDDTTDKHLLAAKLAEFFKNGQSTDNCVATSFDTDLLQKVKANCPQLSLGLVSKVDTKTSLQTAIELGCSFLCLHYSLVEEWDEEIKQAIKQSGLHLSLWTVNEPALLKRLQYLPVDSIITDFPSLFIAALA